MRHWGECIRTCIRGRNQWSISAVAKGANLGVPLPKLPHIDHADTMFRCRATAACIQSSSGTIAAPNPGATSNALL